MPLRIGFDLDGVLADMDSELRRQADGLFRDANDSSMPDRAGEEDAPAPGDALADPVSDFTPPATRLDLTRQQQRRLWRHVRSIENFWERLDETEPGIVRRLAALTASCQWEIIFLTKRPPTPGETAQLQSQRWLEEKGFNLPSVFVVQGSRGRIAAALDLDIVIDDRLENCLDVVTDSKARAILVVRAGESHPSAAQRLGIGVVASVGDCLEILEQMEGARRQPPGVMSRIMRLLGLKESARL